MKNTDFKKHKHGKIGLLLIVIVLIVILVLAVFWVHNNSNSGNSNKVSEKNITYSNNDYSYCPDIKKIDFDHNENIMYFNNLLIAYTFTDLEAEAAKGLADKVDGTIVGDISGSVNALQIKVKESSLEELNEMASILMKDKNVIFAGYDYPIQISDSSISSDPWSSDPKLPESDLGDENKPNGNDWWAEAIGAYTAWDNLNDVSSVKVGIIDSGFDADHNDLNGKISFLDDYKDNSESNHGTHVAGLIGAISDNKIGLRGIVDKVELICVDWSPITNDSSNDSYVNYLSTGEYIEITKRLIENGVKVINNSWGSHIFSKEGFTEDLYGKSNDLLFLLQYFAVNETGAYDSYLDYVKAYAKRTGLDSMLLLIELMINKQEDFIVVQAAGNGYDNGGKGYNAKDNSGFYCSVSNDLYNDFLSKDIKSHLSELGINYNKIKDHIFIVGAVKNQKNGNDYTMTSFSNFGSSIDICAPGENIFSSITNNEYKSDSGTSMAAPIVAGSIALMWANDKNLTASQIKNILINSSTAKAIGVGDGKGKNYPMLNIGNAILSQNAETLFTDYLINKLKLIDASKFSFSQDEKTGVFSIAIDDFDNNGLDEMVTFSLTENAAFQKEIVIDLFCIENGSVVKKQSSQHIFASMAGNGESFLCGTIEDGIIRIYRTTGSYGGSSISSEYLSYKVKNNGLILCDDYLLGEFYRYESYVYEEKVSSKNYSDVNDWYADVKSAGYDYKYHSHGIYSLSEADSAKLEELKGNHIFSFLNGKDFSLQGIYGYIFDNSKLKDILPQDIEPENKNESTDLLSLILDNTWENDIQSHNEYVFQDNGSLTENPDEYPRFLNYSLDGDTLTIIWDGEYTTKLKYVNKSDDIDWEKDLFFYYNIYPNLADDEGFFYEIDYEPDELGLENVYWLRIKH